MKDEALSNDQVKINLFPIAKIPSEMRNNFNDLIEGISAQVEIRTEAGFIVLDWLRHEFGLDRPGQALAQPHRLDADGFVAAVRKALPASRKLSAAEIARLKREHGETVEPARRAADEVRALERTLSDLVNAAYGLTPEEVALMWATAPPRMPLVGPA